MYSTPKTNNSWVERVSKATETERNDLVWHRPIIAWFSEKKLAFHRLYKLPGRLGNDLWFVQGRGDSVGFEQDLHGSASATTLKVCLRTLTVENGWALCEFASEVEFLEATLAYLKQKPD